MRSRSVVGTPILSFADCSDKNIITLSLSDAETPSMICGGYSEQTGGIDFKIELLSGRSDARDDLQLQTEKILSYAKMQRYTVTETFMESGSMILLLIIA